MFNGLTIELFCGQPYCGEFSPFSVITTLWGNSDAYCTIKNADNSSAQDTVAKGII